MQTVSTAALAAVVVLAGCATQQRFDVAKVEQLRPGVTTIAEAEQTLGTATSRSALANGSTLLQWMSNDGNILTGPRGAHVSVLFDAGGRMVRVTHKAVVGS